MNRMKKFDELTITDDFLFGAVMSDPDICRPLLEYILNISIKSIKYPEKQKAVDIEYDAKSVRLDLYVTDDKGSVYNVEIQTTSNRNLPKRIRYYRDMLDLNQLEKSEDYCELTKTYVIFICTFDFFGRDRYMYTFRSRCEEESDIYLEDESEAIILNTKGSVGNINDELKGVLEYMNGKTPAAGFAQNIDNAVKRVKSNEKWRFDYMTYAVKIQEHEAAARKEGRQEGIKEGRKEGRREGRKEGRKEGIQIGELKTTISVFRTLKNTMERDMIMNTLRIDSNRYRDISDLIDSHPEMSDDEAAQKLLGYENKD